VYNFQKKDKFYDESKEVFSKLGLTFADAVNIFLAKVVMTNWGGIS